MFKNKKIVALVLCAMMLFVPVAAMADALSYDYLGELDTATNNDFSKLSEKATDFQAAVGAALGKFKDENAKVAEIEKAKKAVDDAQVAYEKALKKANEEVDEINQLMSKVKEFGPAKFFKGNGGILADSTRTTTGEATTLWTNITKKNGKLELAMNAFEAAKEMYANQGASYELAKALYPIALQIAKNGMNATNAKAIIVEYAKAYERLDEQGRAAFAPAVLNAWKAFEKYASDFEKSSVLTQAGDHFKALIAKGETKYEVMSTGEKGWILSDEAKNGCLQNVAEFKVEKKDGKFVAKVYGKDGKEMKIGQQLTVYRPIGKDVKVLKAKVDGKDVTFSVGLRNGQNYVSVPVIY